MKKLKKHNYTTAPPPSRDGGATNKKKMSNKKKKVRSAARVVLHHIIGTGIDPRLFSVGNETESAHKVLSNNAIIPRAWASVKGKVALVAAIDELVKIIGK